MTRRLAPAVVLAATLGLAAAPRAAAQATGTTAGAVAAIPATTRALGLGGAYTAVIGDVGSIFVNPAGLAPVRTVALGMSYERYLLGSTLVSGGVAFGAGRFVLGVGASLLDFGQDTVYRPDPAFGGDRGLPDPAGAMAGAYSALAVGSVAYRLGMLALGVNAKYLAEHVSVPDTALYDASGLGFDAGVALAFFDIAALGVVVQNIGGPMRGDSLATPLPHTTRVGFTFNIFDPQGTRRLMSTTEWVSPPGHDAYWIFGFEAGAVSGGVGLLGRIGFVAGRRRTDLHSPVLGGGLVFHTVRLDYAYQGLDALGEGMHRFTLGWVW